MATGAPDRDMFIPNILVSAYPDLVSNFSFLDSFEIANAIAGDSHDKLKKLGYAVKLDQHLTGAGGPGIFPGVLDLIQLLWESKSLITLPIAVIKFIYNRIKHRNAKLPAQSKRLAKVNVNLKAYSETLSVGGGVFTEKESILNTLLECATILAPVLQEKYPHIAFTFELELKLDEHKAQLVYTLASSELGYRRLPSLFKCVALSENMTSRLSVTKKLFFKREDWKVDAKSTGSVWSYEPKIKKFYYLIVGRIAFRDYMPPIDHSDQ
jgi:hypothetical protein